MMLREKCGAMPFGDCALRGLGKVVVFVAIACGWATAQAESPQISRGLSVIMQNTIQYEERQRDGKENPLYFGDRSPTPTNPKPLAFADHLQLLSYFNTLTPDQKSGGLWVKRMARPLWRKADEERIAALTNDAKKTNVLLFICEPSAPSKGSWLVTWNCEKTIPKVDGRAVICEAIESKTNPTQWLCKEK
jgi:hypothetical protein